MRNFLESCRTFLRVLIIIGCFFGETTLAFPTRTYNSVDVYFSAAFRFPELAGGGSLVIVNLSGDEPEEVSIMTLEGEGHDSVSQKIADALLIAESPKLMPSVYFPVDYDKDRLRALWRSEGVVSTTGRPGEIILGSKTDSLGILPPAGSLSALYDAASRSYTLRWHERNQYDMLYARQLGTQWYDVAERHGRGYENSLEIATSDLMREARRPLYVVGFRNGLPTNASYVLAWKDQQVDCFFHPFTGELTTNWTGWQSTVDSTPNFTELRFSDVWPAPPVDGWKQTVNRSAQLIQSDREEVDGGMYRFFIAQEPGRIYRPALRYSIMDEVENFEGDWSFEVMVGAIDPGLAYEMDNATRVLTGDYWEEFKMAGTQVAHWRLNNGDNELDGWNLVQTDATNSNMPQKDIRLGHENTAIFFCVRLKGHKPNGIAIDGVRLVDVTDGFPDIEARETAL